MSVVSFVAPPQLPPTAKLAIMYIGRFFMSDGVAAVPTATPSRYQ